jgi:hypothetical protein
MTKFDLYSLGTLVAAAMVAVPAAAQSASASRDLQRSEQASAIYRRDTGIDDSGRYQHELEACRSGRTQQSRDTCMEEARNAHAEKMRGQLGHGQEDYAANALARCTPLRGEYRAACEARVMGFGTASGSVAGGGLLRQVETVVMPAGEDSLRIDAQTADPVVLVPAR